MTLKPLRFSPSRLPLGRDDVLPPSVAEDSTHHSPPRLVGTVGTVRLNFAALHRASSETLVALGSVSLVESRKSEGGEVGVDLLETLDELTLEGIPHLGL